MVSNDTLKRYAVFPASIFLFILPFTHTVALRLLCLFIAFIIVCYLWWREPPPQLACKWPLLAWAAVCWLSLTWSIEPNYSFGELCNEVGYTMAAFFTFFYLTQTKADWRRWRNVILASFCIISIYAIFSYFYYGDWSTAGRLGDRNAYSTYLILVAPFLLLSVVKLGIGPGLGRLIWVTLPLAMVSGFFTLNRIMWPTLVVVALIFFVLYLRKHGTKARLAGAGICVVLCGIFVVEFGTVSQVKSSMAKFNVADLTENVAQDPRSRIWAYAGNKIAEKPWAGYGYGRGILRKDFREHFNNPLLWHGHNMLVNYAMETGLLGAAALLVLFVALLRQFWKLYQAGDPSIWQLGVFGLTLMAGLLIKASTDDILVRDNALLLWAFMGMSLGLGARLPANLHQLNGQ